ncbi:replication initiator protein A [Psychrilyobacter atlanticus]|uniref:replication initiator protein A n=1 Tax=Psychrilyobacter atlanticus TaxID=271091 RepID=UPI00048C067C|nr:replication initiator protein A [Psychrilyobacter atlanticus]
MWKIDKNLIITKKDLEEDNKYIYEVDRYGQFLFPNWVLKLGLIDNSLYVYIEMLHKLLSSSIKNNWVDKDNKVFIYYDNEELKKNLIENNITFNPEEDLDNILNLLIDREFILKEETNKYYFRHITFNFK